MTNEFDNGGRTGLILSLDPGLSLSANKFLAYDL